MMVTRENYLTANKKKGTRITAVERGEVMRRLANNETPASISLSMSISTNRIYYISQYRSSSDDMAKFRDAIREFYGLEPLRK